MQKKARVAFRSEKVPEQGCFVSDLGVEMAKK
jgi:hypothetical protein